MTVHWEHRDADGDVVGFDVDVDDTMTHLQAEYGCVYITPEAALALAIELFRWAAPQVPPAANQAHADITDLLTELGITMQRSQPMPEVINPNPNVGHGHVFPRPDGARARCGEPGLCPDCSRDQATAQRPRDQRRSLTAAEIAERSRPR